MAFLGFGKTTKAQSTSEPVMVDAAAAAAQSQTVQQQFVPPQNIRRELFDAACRAAAGDDKTLRHLCSRHAKLIRAQVLLPASIPSAIRANPTLLRWYRDGLIAIADLCPAGVAPAGAKQPVAVSYPKPKGAAQVDRSLGAS